MKKILLSLSMFTVLFAAVTFSQSDSTATISPPSPVVVILDTFEIGGTEYYQLADLIDSTYQNVRYVIAEVKAAKAKTWLDYLELFLKLVTGGVVASLWAQGLRIWLVLKTSISKLPRGELPVIVISVVVGGIWLYLETKFVGFSFEALFYKTAGVFIIAVGAWRLGLSRLFVKPKEAGKKTDAVVHHLVVELQGKGVIGPLPADLNEPLHRD